MIEKGEIGFDRRLKLPWLDFTADLVAQGQPAAEIRQALSRHLEGVLAESGTRGARSRPLPSFAAWCNDGMPWTHCATTRSGSARCPERRRLAPHRQRSPPTPSFFRQWNAGPLLRLKTSARGHPTSVSSGATVSACARPARDPDRARLGSLRLPSRRGPTCCRTSNGIWLCEHFSWGPTHHGASR
jgi:hypothetical protein